MLNKLVNFLGKAALKSGKKGLCPQCKATEQEPSGEVMVCRACGFTGTILEFFPTQEKGPQGVAGQPPAQTRIVKRDLPTGGVAFEIPPTKKSSGLLFFAIIWNGFMAVFSLLASTGSVSSTSSKPGSTLAIIIFIGLFWLVGIGLLFAALRMMFAKHLLLTDRETLVHVRELFGRKKTHSLRYAEISSIENTVFYTQNYQPVYGVEIVGAQKKIRLGSSLSDAEKGWLVAELKALVFPPKASTPRTANDDMMLEIPTSGLLHSTRPARAERFELNLDPVSFRASGLILGSLLGVLITGGFVGLGLSPLMEDAGFFRIAWVGINFLFLAIIIAGIISQIRASKTRIKAISDGENLHVVHIKAGREAKRERIPLADIRRIAIVTNGHLNDIERKAAQVITAQKVFPIYSWRRDLEAIKFAEKLRDKLGVNE